MDNFVQDWKYWGAYGWSPVWDESLYPDPAGMVQELHDTYDVRYLNGPFAMDEDPDNTRRPLFPRNGLKFERVSRRTIQQYNNASTILLPIFLFE